LKKFGPISFSIPLSAGLDVIDVYCIKNCRETANNNAGASFPPAMTASGRGLLPPHNHRASAPRVEAATDFSHRQRSSRPAA